MSKKTKDEQRRLAKAVKELTGELWIVQEKINSARGAALEIAKDDAAYPAEIADCAAVTLQAALDVTNEMEARLTRLEGGAA